ncbi:MAG: hypothetical protein WC627_05715 [Legionella sp.]|jgi:hypothetical protein
MNRLALVAVTGVLALSLTACGEQTPPAKSETTVVVQPAAQPAQQPAAQPAEQPAAQPAEQPAGENH